MVSGINVREPTVGWGKSIIEQHMKHLHCNLTDSDDSNHSLNNCEDYKFDTVAEIGIKDSSDYFHQKVDIYDLWDGGHNHG